MRSDMLALVTAAPPSWAFLQSWRVPRHVPDWEVLRPWLAGLEQLTAAQREELASLREWWDRELADLGGDPSATDWTSFAPLRRDREEDWSAWLAQLIADSETGAFSASLFGAADPRPRAAFRGPLVHRELVVEDRRADLVIEWADATYSHVEVKVGDPHLAKTPDTATKVRKAMPHCERGLDFLLVLPEQSAAWSATRESAEDECRGIHLLTWRDVSVALRQALVASEREPARWRVWAHALCGATEQELLGLSPGANAEQWCRSLRVTSIHAAEDLLRAGRRPTE